MGLKVYLAGEIHTDWRNEIIGDCKKNNLDIDLSNYPSGSYYLYFNSEDAVQGCRLEEVQKVSTKIILIK